jgi:hypothetical protein
VISDTELILDQVATLIEGGAGLGSVQGRTVVLTWIPSTNPEFMLCPFDAYLVCLWSNQATNTIYISTDGRIAIGNPGVTGQSGSLLAAFVPNGTATCPWYGRSRVHKGVPLWVGGTAASTEAVLTFELIEESPPVVRQPPVIPPHRRRRTRG